MAKKRSREGDEPEKKKKYSEEETVGVMLSDIYESEKQFIPTGITTLDMSLGGTAESDGGFLRGSVINIIGDESSGKTLLALCGAKGCQNIGGGIMFIDAESALDVFRAVKVFKIDPSNFRYARKVRTIERWEENLQRTVELAKKEKRPYLHITDSLDAISTEKEMESGEQKMDIDLLKNKLINRVFRKMVDDFSEFDVTVVIISQTRTKIGIMFGDPKDISGAGALKFYAMQRIKMAKLAKIKEGKDRVVGNDNKAIIIKNKVIEPYHTADFPIYYNEGVDDVEACINFLLEHKSDRIVRVQDKKKIFTYKDNEFDSSDELTAFIREKDKRIERLRKWTRETWREGVMLK